MIGFKPNEYVEPENEKYREPDFEKFRRERMNLRSTEVQDAYRRYNRHHRSI